jgi:ABC-type phosphate transport system permease subunit
MSTTAIWATVAVVVWIASIPVVAGLFVGSHEEPKRSDPDCLGPAILCGVLWPVAVPMVVMFAIGVLVAAWVSKPNKPKQERVYDTHA